MKKRLITDKIKRMGKKAKSKRGATLIEMVATVAILSIVATMSLQSMFMAAEEYRRVDNLSQAQRSISLMQENFSKYAKTAVNVELVNRWSGEANISDAINKFVDEKNAPASLDPLCDSEDSTHNDKYNDYILYRSGTFAYTLAKYQRFAVGGSSAFIPIFTVENIKEINFNFKGILSTRDASGNEQYMLDFTITSPTNEEIKIQKSVQNSGLPATDLDNAIRNNIGGGDYSISTGTILNNMFGTYSTSVPTMRISEGLTSTGSDDSDKNFVFIRTTPKVANE